jgi:hypothetical protein
MEQDPNKPSPKGRLFTAAALSVGFTRPESLLASLTEINELLTGQASGDFGIVEIDRQKFRNSLMHFIKDARGGSAQCLIKLGDNGRSKLEFEMVDGELSITVTPDSDPNVKDRWDALT